MGYLYKLDFPNGKSYIGLTFNSIKSRFYSHLYKSNSSNLPLYNAWRKYGPPDLKVLAVINNDDVHNSEIKAISIYKTKFPLGYNLTDGGEGTKGAVASFETRLKISNAKKGKPSPNKGNKYSDEVRRNLSEKLKGRIPWNKGLTASNVAKLNQSLSHIGFKHTPESIEKMKIASKARPITPEMRKKMWATRKLNKVSKNEN